jgi:hypothetical protein
MRQSRFSFFVIFVALPLILGTAIYLLWRADTLTAFRWFMVIEMSDTLDTLRDVVGHWSGPQWALYSLPGGLWAFAATNAMGAMWLKDWHPESFVWIALPLVFAWGTEWAQFFQQFAGTYSALDLFAYLLGWFGGIFLLMGFRIREDRVDVSNR